MVWLGMQTMAISEFKAKCLAVLEQVRVTGEPVLVTRRGQPVAEVNPPLPERDGFVFGRARGRGRILGDIVEPVIDLADIEALKD